MKNPAEAGFLVTNCFNSNADTVTIVDVSDISRGLFILRPNVPESIFRDNFED